jgi:heat shock protein HslJ
MADLTHKRFMLAEVCPRPTDFSEVLYEDLMLNFKDSTSFSVNTPVNRGGGTYTIDGDSLTFGKGVFWTEMAGNGARGAAEGWMHALLRKSGSYRVDIQSDHFTLTHRDHPEKVIKFNRCQH